MFAHSYSEKLSRMCYGE